jgi:hypothetical protein
MRYFIVIAIQLCFRVRHSEGAREERDWNSMLGMFENRILRGILGGWRRLHNEGFIIYTLHKILLQCSN